MAKTQSKLSSKAKRALVPTWSPVVGQRVIHPGLGGGVVTVGLETTGNGNVVVRFYRDQRALEGPVNTLAPDLRSLPVIHGGRSTEGAWTLRHVGRS